MHSPTFAYLGRCLLSLLDHVALQLCRNKIRPCSGSSGNLVLRREIGHRRCSALHTLLRLAGGCVCFFYLCKIGRLFGSLDFFRRSALLFCVVYDVAGACCRGDASFSVSHGGGLGEK